MTTSNFGEAVGQVPFDLQVRNFAVDGVAKPRLSGIGGGVQNDRTNVLREQWKQSGTNQGRFSASRRTRDSPHAPHVGRVTDFANPVSPMAQTFRQSVPVPHARQQLNKEVRISPLIRPQAPGNDRLLGKGTIRLRVPFTWHKNRESRLVRRRDFSRIQPMLKIIR